VNIISDKWRQIFNGNGTRGPTAAGLTADIDLTLNPQCYCNFLIYRSHDSLFGNEAVAIVRVPCPPFRKLLEAAGKNVDGPSDLSS
jgi:hypothetical protein